MTDDITIKNKEQLIGCIFCRIYEECYAISRHQWQGQVIIYHSICEISLVPALGICFWHNTPSWYGEYRVMQLKKNFPATPKTDVQYWMCLEQETAKFHNFSCPIKCGISIFHPLNYSMHLLSHTKRFCNPGCYRHILSLPRNDGKCIQI